MMAGISKDPQLNQIVSEFNARFVQVILESRVPACKPVSSHGEHGFASTSRPTAQGRAFNIALGKLGADIDRIEQCCNNVQDHMVIDILFSKQGNRTLEGLRQKMGQNKGKTLVHAPTGIVITGSGLEQPIILERWTVEFVQHSSKLAMAERKTDLQVEEGKIGQHLRGFQRFRSSGNDGRGGSSKKTEIASAYDVVERKMALLLRSVYCTTRLLPAHHLFRFLCMSTGKCQFKLSYRLTASPSALPEGHRKDMTTFCLSSIELDGRYLQISVTHRRKNPSMEHERFAICPQIITDYIGRATSLPSKQVQTESSGSLLFLPSSAQRLSSFKFDNLQLHQAPIKKVEAACTISMDCGDFTLVEDEGFDCPFAINDDRAKSAKLRSVKSELGSTGRNPPQASRGPLAAYSAFQKPAAPLSGAYQPKKGAANSLKELQMYVNFKDSLLK